MSILRFFLAVLAVMCVNPDSRQALRITPVTMSFAGDCTVGTQKGGSGQGTFNWYAENYEPEYFLEKVAPIFGSDDFTVVNCECVLSDNGLSEASKGSETAYWFLGPASNARVFSTSSVEIVGFSNNHMRDYGPRGVTDTIDALEAQGLTVAKHEEPCYVEKDGFTIGILACRMNGAGDEKKLYGLLDTMSENSDFQVIFIHGGTEASHDVDSWRQTGFRRLIDRGADLVVCSHPHVLQPVEHYNGGAIVYSLGNFCYGGSKHPENATAIYQCRILKTPLGVFFTDSVIPCYVYTGSINNYQPCPIEEDDPAYGKIIEYMTE